MFGYIYKKDVAMIAVALCLCLGVGSFFDYQISSALFNIGSMYGRFIEAAGELPFELTASIAGVMLVRAVRPRLQGGANGSPRSASSSTLAWPATRLSDRCASAASSSRFSWC